VFRIGGDGGLLEKPEALTQVHLVPGERVELWVVFDAPTDGPQRVFAEDANRFHLPAPQPAEPLFTVEVVPAVEGQPAATLPDTLRTIAPLDTRTALPRTLTLGEAGDGGLPVLTINGQPSWDAPPLQAELGSTETWTVVNDTEYDHPVHLHGYFFQVLDVGGKPWPVEWKDTVNLPRKQRLRFAVAFDERPGMWMFHCHILDHVELGMMAMLEVMPP
jgi:FtsP/CotA-like multicopper oxidase with cupredoxin domain